MTNLPPILRGRPRATTGQAVLRYRAKLQADKEVVYSYFCVDCDRKVSDHYPYREGHYCSRFHRFLAAWETVVWRDPPWSSDSGTGSMS